MHPITDYSNTNEAEALAETYGPCLEAMTLEQAQQLIQTYSERLNEDPPQIAGLITGLCDRITYMSFPVPA